MSNTFSAIRNNEACQSPSLFLMPEKGYPTPKVDLRAGVFESDRVLLVRETSDGRWSLPGGWADEHDSPKQGIEREVLEESGYVVDAVKLVAIKDRHLHPYTPQRLERIYKLFFLCEVRGGAPQASIETSEVGWFCVDDLPELSVGRTLGESCLFAKPRTGGGRCPAAGRTSTTRRNKVLNGRCWKNPAMSLTRSNWSQSKIDTCTRIRRNGWNASTSCFSCVRCEAALRKPRSRLLRWVGFASTIYRS